MSCKHISSRAQAEQDYWLTFADRRSVTQKERLTFLRYDSHGGKRPPEDNPVFSGKKRHDQHVESVRESYSDLDGGWPGGLYIVAEAISTGEAYRDSRKPLRFWRAAFGDEATRRWVSALLHYAFGFFSIKPEEEAMK